MWPSVASLFWEQQSATASSACLLAKSGSRPFISSSADYAQRKRSTLPSLSALMLLLLLWNDVVRGHEIEFLVHKRYMMLASNGHGRQMLCKGCMMREQHQLSCGRSVVVGILYLQPLLCKKVALVTLVSLHCLLFTSLIHERGIPVQQR